MSLFSTSFDSLDSPFSPSSNLFWNSRLFKSILITFCIVKERCEVFFVTDMQFVKRRMKNGGERGIRTLDRFNPIRP